LAIRADCFASFAMTINVSSFEPFRDGFPKINKKSVALVFCRVYGGLAMKKFSLALILAAVPFSLQLVAMNDEGGMSIACSLGFVPIIAKLPRKALEKNTSRHNIDLQSLNINGQEMTKLLSYARKEIDEKTASLELSFNGFRKIKGEASVYYQIDASSSSNQYLLHIVKLNIFDGTSAPQKQFKVALEKLPL
jgi:hypothetical protein